MAIQLPSRMKKLPQYRGMAVPCTIFVDSNGVPQFKVIDTNKRLKMLIERRCAICGDKLDSRVALIGGDACKDSGLFVNGPMHKACAEYSISVCPYLLGQTDYAKTHKDYQGIAVNVIESVGLTRPKSMHLFLTDQWDMAAEEGDDQVLVRMLSTVSVTDIDLFPAHKTK